jgi:hypothetical protein
MEVTMKIMLSAAVIAVTALPALAIEPPKFDNPTCTPIEMRLAHPGLAELGTAESCAKQQAEFKQMLSRMTVDPALGKFCQADAEYRGTGYVAMYLCIDRERSQIAFEKIRGSFHTDRYCEALGGRDEKVYSICRDREKREIETLRERLGTVEEAKLERCAASTKSGDGAAKTFRDCID